MLRPEQIGLETKGGTLYRCTLCGAVGLAWLRLREFPDRRLPLSPGDWTQYTGTVEIEGCKCPKPSPAAVKGPDLAGMTHQDGS